MSDAPDMPSGDECPDGIGGRVEWLRCDGPESDVVMSSRVRLARNLSGFPFVNHASRQQRQETLDACKEHLIEAELAPDLLMLDLHSTNELDRRALVERQLISAQHARGKLRKGVGGVEEPRGVAYTPDIERLSVMINEEDHLRMQVLRSGFALDEALEEIDRVDDVLESRLDFAYSARFGYLTACPTNVGTGIRFSVMLHLRGLRLTGEVERVRRAADAMRLALRGFYGEGSEPLGDFYQISNQTTLGRSERDLLSSLTETIIPQVIAYERDSRQRLLKKRRDNVTDATYRAMGVLRHARLLKNEEAMQLFSRLRLGILLGTVEELDESVVNPLFLLSQPAHLQQAIGAELTQEQRLVARAQLVRRRIAAGLGEA